MDTQKPESRIVAETVEALEGQIGYCPVAFECSDGVEMGGQAPLWIRTRFADHGDEAPT